MAVLLAYVYVCAVAFGAITLGIALGATGEAPTRDRIMETFGPVVIGGIYLVMFSPLAAIYLIPYRVLIHVIGRPRSVALAAAGLVAVLIWSFAPERDVGRLAVGTLLLIGYAAVIRVPEQGFRTLPAAVQGAIVGILLTMIFPIVGSFAAIGWAAVNATRGRWAEAGAMAIAGTAGPGLLMLADLFREDVPSSNRLATGLLLMGTVFGASLLAIARRNRMSAASAA